MGATTEPLERARATAATIEGWLTDAEGELLFQLAAACPPGTAIVEIGSWKGKSTVWLASGLRPLAGTQVFAIDPHEKSLEDPSANTFEEFRANLARAGVASTVTPVVAGSQEAVRTFTEPFQLLFVDGDHSEAGASRDLQLWFPKLATGGIMALHDVINPTVSGPRRALREWLRMSTEITAVQFVDSIAWMKKVKRSSMGDRLRNRLAVLLLVAYEIRPAWLPGPIAALLRFVYRRTPLKRRGRLPS